MSRQGDCSHSDSSLRMEQTVVAEKSKQMHQYVVLTLLDEFCSLHCYRILTLRATLATLAMCCTTWISIWLTYFQCYVDGSYNLNESNIVPLNESTI
jgi:hypothetical protein